MAITNANMDTIRGLNPSMRFELYPDTNNVSDNRIIVYGLDGQVTSATITCTGVNVTGIEWQKAIYTGIRYFNTIKTAIYYKDLTVTVL